MGVNYKWRLAYSIARIGFSSDDRARDNFPELIAYGRIARMQHPNDLGAEKVLAGALLDDCKRGDLLHTTTTRRVMTQAARNVTPSKFSVKDWSPQYTRGGIPYGYTIPAQYKEETTYAVTAPAFAAWLAAQGETPSPHIQAWFDAVGVAGAAESDAPVAVMPAIDGPATLTTNKIAGCFGGLHSWDFDHWKSNLQTPPKWLIECRDKPGQRGKPITEATWFPVKIAVAVASKDKSAIRKIYQKFKSMDDLKPWLESLEINLPSDQ